MPRSGAASNAGGEEVREVRLHRVVMDGRAGTLGVQTANVAAAREEHLRGGECADAPTSRLWLVVQCPKAVGAGEDRTAAGKP